MRVFLNNELPECDLIVDAVYEGGNKGNTGDDPITKILPVGNQGGFRYAGGIEHPKYIVLYTSGGDLDWPDQIDAETGVFRYYGDNKRPGHELHDTKRKGNLILQKLFDSLHSEESPRDWIPPIFIFEKMPTKRSSRSVQFKGLCVPGTVQTDTKSDLIALWKTSVDQRFQNYLAHFTILSISTISRDWIDDLNARISNSKHAPNEFTNWKSTGQYKALMAPKTSEIRSIEEQIPSKNSDKKVLATIFDHFQQSDRAFEFFAAQVYQMTNTDVIIDEVTRGTSDGGRDAVGRHKIGLASDPIYVDFALEAKCYNPGLSSSKINTLGVKETSRLISRIRNRQYGVIVTTSAVSKQAYTEIRFDQHPIIIISGIDIVSILSERGLNSESKLTTYLNQNFPVN